MQRLSTVRPLRITALMAMAAVTVTATACGGSTHSSSATGVPASTAPIPIAPAGPAAAPAPSGPLTPKGNLAGWHQVFAGDFTQVVPLGSFPSAVSSTWFSYRDGLKDTSKHGTYMPTKVVSIANGVMNVHLHTEHGVHMVAALLPIIPGARGSEGGLLYGRYIIRIRADAVRGYKASVVLWPDSEAWPRDGEIDFPEGDLNGRILGFVHHQNGVSKDDQTGFTTAAAYAEWHTATITWLPHEISFKLDKQTVGTVTTRIPDTPMHLVIQIETQTNAPAPHDAAAGNVQIAAVAVYTPACNVAMSIAPQNAACTG